MGARFPPAALHRHCRHCRDVIVGGDDWDGAIILPEIACGISGGCGIVFVVVVDLHVVGIIIPL